MSRWSRAAPVSLLIAGLALPAQQKPSAQKPPEPQEQAPPEEDEAEKPKEYSFNPLQAEKEVRIGNYYFRKGNYRAAALRFREATRWNTNFSEAYLQLGVAEEKRKDWRAAREAYEKFIELAPDDKRSSDIRKRIERLSKGKR